MAQFEAASQLLPEGTDENHVKPVTIVSVFQLVFKLSTSCLHVISITV
jgi:hypothetical protein